VFRVGLGVAEGVGRVSGAGQREREIEAERRRD